MHVRSFATPINLVAVEPFLCKHFRYCYLAEI